MHWTLLLLVVAAVLAVLWFKRSGQVRTEDALTLLQRGTPVIDVRSTAEFAEQSVAGAVNIPLDRLTDEVPRRFPDRSQPLLLHCLSGGRSLMATRTLRGLGYTQAHNLGSLARARALVNRSRTPPP